MRAILVGTGWIKDQTLSEMDICLCYATLWHPSRARLFDLQIARTSYVLVGDACKTIRYGDGDGILYRS